MNIVMQACPPSMANSRISTPTAWMARPPWPRPITCSSARKEGGMKEEVLRIKAEITGAQLWATVGGPDSANEHIPARPCAVQPMEIHQGNTRHSHE